MKYEYTTVRCGDRESFDHELDEHGQNNWRVVGFSGPDAFGNLYALLERELKDDPHEP